VIHVFRDVSLEIVCKIFIFVIKIVIKELKQGLILATCKELYSLPVGDTCYSDNQCQSGVCVSNLCGERGVIGLGNVCANNLSCVTGYCSCGKKKCKSNHLFPFTGRFVCNFSWRPGICSM
jgi:hypothetical protein